MRLSAEAAAPWGTCRAGRGPRRGPGRKCPEAAAFDARQAHRDAIERAQVLAGQHRRGRPLRQHLAFAQQECAVGDLKGMVGIVGAKQHANAVVPQARDFDKHPRLVAEVEIGGWLVQDDRLRFGHQRAGDQRKLPLAAAHLGDGPIRQRRDAEPLERARREDLVAFTGMCERAEVRGAAHRHHLQYAEIEVTA